VLSENSTGELGSFKNGDMTKKKMVSKDTFLFFHENYFRGYYLMLIKQSDSRF